MHLPKQRPQNNKAVSTEWLELKSEEIYLQQLIDEVNISYEKINILSTGVYFGIGSL